MNTNSAALFLFQHNTDTSEEDIYAELKNSAERRRDVIWEAGSLTVRLLSNPGKAGRKSHPPRFRDIVCDSDICSPRLAADLTRIECDRVKSRNSPATFRSQLVQCALGAAALLSGLCMLGALLAFCAFVIGVAIPFGLFS